MSNKPSDSFAGVYQDLHEYKKPLPQELADLLDGIWSAHSSGTLSGRLQDAGDKKSGLLKQGLARYLKDANGLGKEIAEEMMSRVDQGGIQKKNSIFSKENRPEDIRKAISNINKVVVQYAVEEGQSIGVTQATTPDDVFFDPQ